MQWLHNTRDGLNAPQVCAHLVHGAYFMIIFKNTVYECLLQYEALATTK